jgi:hypothetical protein
MVKRRKAYTLRYGESRKNDMLVYFDDNETVLENLSKLIPSAIQRGFLPPECSAENVKLIYEGKPLNLNVSIPQQEVTIAERAILIIQDMSSTVRIKVNYTPDNHAERSDTVYVNPNKIVGSELEKFFDVVTKDYSFYRRKPKKYHLITDGKKVKLNKSLAAQSIESGFDAKLAPRLIFRWPPSKLAILLASAVVVVLLGFVFWSIYVNYLRRPPVVERFYVTFIADAESQLLTPDTTLVMHPNAPQILALDPGLHEFEVMPKDYPIFPYHFTLVSEGAVSDSLTKSIAIPTRFTDAAPLILVITGYQGGENPEYRVKEGLSINGHQRPVDEFGVLRIELLHGLYEIKYDLDEELLDIDNMKFDPKVLRPTPFRFDFSAYDGEATFVTFHYFRSR